MDSTLAYSIAAGIAIVFLFFLAKFALRWFIRISIVAVIIAALIGAAWIWFNSSSTPPDNKPRSTPARRASTEKQ
jgi:energy-coupling factor transporter transmembrane protein EcfT